MHKLIRYICIQCSNEYTTFGAILISYRIASHRQMKSLSMKRINQTGHLMTLHLTNILQWILIRATDEHISSKMYLENAPNYNIHAENPESPTFRTSILHKPNVQCCTSIIWKNVKHCFYCKKCVCVCGCGHNHQVKEREKRNEIYRDQDE